MATQFIWGPLKALIERFDEHNFGPTEIQRWLENFDFLLRIGNGTIPRELLVKVIGEMANPFAREKTEVRYFYPKGWSPTTIFDQQKVLQDFYPYLDASHVVEVAKGIAVPQAADGLFIIPKLSRVAVELGIENPYGEGYGQMLESTVLAHLARQRQFHNYRAGELTADRVRMRQLAIDAIAKLEKEQPGDFLVLAAQTGQKWGGYSPRNARWEMERGTTEFPLPAWVVGHVLLTNPKRLENLEKYEHLAIDCSGDEYRSGGGAEFESGLCFCFSGGRLRFYRRWLGDASGDCGSASGFVR
ncbi:MAG: hypothetical protein AAB486_02255 [Patescibacteria group bacterium]